MSGPRHIFLDLDGVLTNFVGASLQLHSRSELLESWPAGVWDTHVVCGMSNGDFWKVIELRGSAFWSDMEPYPWAFDLVEQLRQIAPVTIASSPSLDPGSLDGKIRWLQKHFGRNFRDFMIGPRKHLLAHPDTVLIDDSDRNIADFRKAGGRGVLFPQMWNANHDKCAVRIAYVLEEAAKPVEKGADFSISSMVDIRPRSEP